MTPLTAPHRLLAAVLTALLLAGCAGAPERPPSANTSGQAKTDDALPVLPAAGSGGGGYYQDDGPGEHPPANLRALPDAVFKAEPLLRAANRPYVVFGTSYTPLLDNAPFSQRGMATWYGKKFHGQRTSSGEPYDMYKMTAAHPTLPIPSYARITNLDSGEQVVVRINDRGPFRSSRIVDVSYTAALKLGLLGKGSHEVSVERVLSNELSRTAPATLPEAPAHPRSDGYYLQLGAFGRADAATEVRARVLASGTLAPVEVVQGGALHRLFGGPFANREAALQAARALPASLAIKPTVIRRSAD